MPRLLLATISFLSLTACAVDALPDDGGGNGADGGNGGDGGGDAGGDRDGKELTVPEFLTAFSMRECDDAFACMSTFPADSPLTFTALYGPSEAVCYASSAARYDAAAVAASIAAGRIAFDGAAAAACIAGIGEPACGTFWTLGPAYPAACDEALAGTIPDGGTCAIDFECANHRSTCDAATKKCARRLKLGYR